MREGEWLRGIAMLVAFTAAATAQILVTREPYDLGAWALYTFACVLLALASPVRSFARIDPSTERVPQLDLTRKFLLLVSIIAVAAATLVPSTYFPPPLALLAWAGGLLIALVATRGRNISQPRTVQPWTNLELIGFAGIVSLAALARFTWIDAIPGRYFDDESRVGLVALELSRKGVADFFTLGWNAWPVLGLAVQGSFGIATDISTTTLRLTSAAFGTLAVVMTYMAARELFSPRLALLAAFLLAINRTAIDLSRLGTPHAHVMVLAPLAFALWWRGINTGRTSSYVGAGIAMGLALYTYNAGQLIIAVWLVWIALATFVTLASRLVGRRKRRGEEVSGPHSLKASGPYVRGAALTFAVFCLTIAPLLSRVTDRLTFGPVWHEWLALGRGRQVVSEVVERVQKNDTELAVTFLRSQTSSTWLGFFALPSKAYGLGYRGGGMSDDVTAALFLLGLALCLFGRFQRRGDFVLGWWAVMALLGNVLTRDPPIFQRLVGAVPAVAILAALPLEVALDWARESRRKLRLAVALISILAAVAVWQNWRTYFIEFAEQPLDYPSTLARTLQQIPRDRAVVLAGSEYAYYASGWLQNQLSFQHELIRVNFRDRDLREATDTAAVLPLRSDSKPLSVIVLGPTQVTQTNYVRQLYPNARIQMYGQERHVFALAEVPLPEVLAMSGLRLRRLSPEGPVDLGVRDPFASEFFDPCVDPPSLGRFGRRATQESTKPSSPQAPKPSDKPPSPQAPTPSLPSLGSSGGHACTVEWSGSIYWPHSIEVGLRLSGDGIEQVRLAGTELPLRGEPKVAVARIRLPRGWQPFTLRRTADANQPWSLQLLSGGAEAIARRSDFIPDANQHGLLGIYERDGQRLGETIEAQLNYFVDERFFHGRPDLRFNLPFDVYWHGKLRIERPGRYQFELQAGGDARLELDGRMLIEVKDVPNERVSTGKVERKLDMGLHEIAATWKARPPYPGTPIAAFQLYWQPPGGERELVPPTNFVPDPTAPIISAGATAWCEDDCQRDGVWTVDEIVRVATIALGARPLTSCATADTTRDGSITIEEIVTAVTQALNGCG